MAEAEVVNGAPERIGGVLGYLFFTAICLIMAWTIVGHPYLGL
jgi:hypothetical protein